MADVRGKAARGRVRIVIAVLGLVLGASLVAYPYVSDYLHKLSQAKVIQNLDASVDSESSEALQQELEASLSYNERLRNTRTQITDPFDPNNLPVTDEDYEARLNLAGDGVMGAIIIPSIDATVPIYHGTDDDALQKGAGHLQATSLPVGGESSHAVIAGHNGLPSVRIFDDLHKVAVGDYFIVRVLGEEHAYRVYDIETVEPEDTSSLVIEDGRDLMTLITCTPYGINTHRLLVHAERCEVPAEWYERDKAASEDAKAKPEDAILPLTLVGVAAGGGAVAARLTALRRERRAGGSGGPGDRGPRSGGSRGGGRRAAGGPVGPVVPRGGAGAGGARLDGALPQIPRGGHSEHTSALVDASKAARQARGVGSGVHGGSGAGSGARGGSGAVGMDVGKRIAPDKRPHADKAAGGKRGGLFGRRQGASGGGHDGVGHGRGASGGKHFKG